jgi:thiamine-monophosphate kinase
VTGRFRQGVTGGVAGRAADRERTLAEVGEFGLIDEIRRLAAGMKPESAGAEPLLVGIGDDAAVLSAPGSTVVVTTDLLIEGRHFRRDWSSALDIGRKAAAQNLADVAAMGARPVALLAGFAGPPGLPARWATDLARGLVAECAAAGAVLAGGDTTSADVIVIAGTAVGDLDGRQPVLRSGARPADTVAIAGTVGRSAAGYALLAAGLAGPGAGAGQHGPHAGGEPAPATPLEVTSATPLDPALETLVTAHRHPQPPYPAGPQAARHGATSMIDISDGLVADLGHVARASGVLIDIDSRLLSALPWAAGLREAAAATGFRDWLSWPLTGGEDHGLAATFPPGAELPEGWAAIGTVRAGGPGVHVDGSPPRGPGGWEHFRPATAG